MGGVSKTDVANFLRAHPQRFCEGTLQRFYAEDPTRAGVFAPDPLSFTQVCAAIIDGAPTDVFARQATLIRAFGFDSATFLSLADSARASIRELCEGLPFEAVLEAEQRIAQAALATIPGMDEMPLATPARVVQVERRCRRVTVVRLETTSPLDYAPGQFLSVGSSILPGHYEWLAPSIPANDHGQIEFHIFLDPLGGDSSQLMSYLSAAHADDWWLIGPPSPHSETREFPTGDRLFIALGTGLAPARAVLLDQLMSGTQTRCHLFLAADYPGELYDLLGLWHLAASSPWLSVAPITKNEDDAWWVAPTEHSAPPRGLHLEEVGEPGDVISGYGSWADRDVVIFADASTIDSAPAVKDKLVAAGTPAERIQIAGPPPTLLEALGHSS